MITGKKIPRGTFIRTATSTSIGMKRNNRIRMYLWTCIRTRTNVYAVLPASHNPLLLVSLLIITMLTCLMSLSLKFFNHCWMFFHTRPNFLWVEWTLWCVTYWPAWYFNIMFQGVEGSSDIVLCTNTVELLHYGFLWLILNTRLMLKCKLFTMI